MLKLGIHMENELLYYGIKNQTPCFYSSLYLSIYLSFMAKFVSLFSPELCKLESSNMVYICRVNDCIVGLRLRVMRQTACLVVNPVKVNSFAYLFICTTVGRTLD